MTQAGPTAFQHWWCQPSEKPRDARDDKLKWQLRVACALSLDYGWTGFPTLGFFGSLLHVISSFFHWFDIMIYQCLPPFCILLSSSFLFFGETLRFRRDLRRLGASEPTTDRGRHRSVTPRNCEIGWRDGTLRRFRQAMFDAIFCGCLWIWFSLFHLFWGILIILFGAISREDLQPTSRSAQAVLSNASASPACALGRIAELVLCSQQQLRSRDYVSWCNTWLIAFWVRDVLLILGIFRLCYVYFYVGFEFSLRLVNMIFWTINVLGFSIF